MKVGIWGAAGAVGHHAVPELLRRGHSVRVVGRREDALRKAFGDKVEIVAADLTSADGTAKAADGLDAVVYALGLPYSKTSFANYPPMMRTAVASMRAAGVKRLLHISNVYVYGMPQTDKVREDHPLAPCSVKGTHRLGQETVVREAHVPGEFETIVLRPADYYGTHSLGLIGEVFDVAVKGTGTANLLGPADKPHEFQFVNDLGANVAALVGRDGVWGEAYNVPTAGVISCREFALKVFAAAGGKPKMRVAGLMMQRILGLFMPILRELAEMNYLLRTPVLLDGSKLRAALGDELRVTPYDAGIATTIAAMKAGV
ncbi:MAG: NAD-dependent epimerase/dehydratase family protein [Planctomycetota bacterium]